MKSYIATSKEIKVDAMSSFGQYISHDVFMFRSDNSPIQMARDLGLLFHSSFRFLASDLIALKNVGFECPLFFSVLNVSVGMKAVLMPNKIVTPSGELSPNADPLLGFSLFEEYRYLFNKKGRGEFPCDWVDYDYLLLLHSDKDYDAASEVHRILSSEKKLQVQDASSLMKNEGNKKKLPKSLDFLQKLFMETDIMMTNFQEAWLKKKLHGVVSIPRENYSYRRYDDNTPSLMPMINSPLLRREDY